MRRWLIAILIAVAAAALLFGYGLYRSRSLPAHATMSSGEMADRAARVDAILDRFETGEQQRDPARQVHRIEEIDLNAYIATQLREHHPDGLDSLHVSLAAHDRVAVQAVVDVDKLDLKRNKAAAKIFRTLLRGRQTILVEGELISSDGKAIYRPRALKINDVQLPTGLLTALLDYVGRKQKPPIDFTQPFAMPFNIRELRVRSGYIEVS